MFRVQKRTMYAYQTFVLNRSNGQQDLSFCSEDDIFKQTLWRGYEFFEELKEMILDAVNLAFEDFGFTYTIDEIHFKYDLESFFDFYKVINAKALSERTGMSQSLLAQYTNGIKKPSPSQTKRILQGVQQIGRELTDVRFLL